MPEPTQASADSAAASRAGAKTFALYPLGVVALGLFDGGVRLGLRGLRTAADGLTGPQWAVFAALVVAFTWGEGYLALHRRFSPHVVGRSFAAGSERLLFKLLAPLYAVSLVGAPRRSLLKAWLGLAAITAAVVAVRLMPPPWRGMVDGAVGAALLLGAVSLVGHYCVACARR